MLDIVFIMLIFFIVTTSFVKESGVEINRPSASTAETVKKGNIMVAVRENGQVWVDKRVVEVGAVRANIERLRAEKPGERRGDPGRHRVPFRSGGAGHGPDPHGRCPEHLHRRRQEQLMPERDAMRYLISLAVSCVVVFFLFWE